MKKLIGAVLYEGPSKIDGAPIVVIVTGFRGSANRKTGKMLQTWILRADVDPGQAVALELDGAICGNCPHRRNRGGACYVVPEQAPLSVWRAWQRGSYADWTESVPGAPLLGKVVRFGSYGDPAAVPYNVWRRVRSKGIAGWTGYTHQWRTASSRYRAFLMASVDSPAEQQEAESAGWRTFRVVGPGEQRDPSKETACPSDVVSCVSCGLCRGRGRMARSVAIDVHGYLARRVAKRGRLLPAA